MLKINDIEYPVIKNSQNGLVTIQSGDLTADNTYNMYFNGSQFVIENGSLSATLESAGNVTLNQINAVGMAPQGELPKPSGNIYTYEEMLIIPDGQYNINTQTVFSYLGLGSSFMNTGVLFKKTYTVNGTKRVNLEYINLKKKHIRINELGNLILLIKNN